MKQLKQQKQEVKQIRTALYARYSSDNQSEKSAEDQISFINHYIQNESIKSAIYNDPYIIYNFDIQPKHIFKDEAKTGRNINRDGFTKLTDAIRSKSIDVVLVEDTSRLSRDIAESHTLMQLARSKSVEIISVNDGMSTEDQSSAMAMSFKGVINSDVSKQIGQRSRRAQITRFLAGYSAGDTCYGYTAVSTQHTHKKSLIVPSHFRPEINETEAIIIRRVFDWFISGIGLAQIAKRLNDQRIPSSQRAQKISKKTCNWNQSAIGKLLTQQKYIGVWVWGKSETVKNPDSGRFGKRPAQAKSIVYLNGLKVNDHLRIVSPEMWLKAQLKLSETKRIYHKNKSAAEAMNFAAKTASKSKLVLSGIVFCGRCGGNLLQTTSGSFGCYRQRNKGTNHCSNIRTVKVHKLEAALFNRFSTMADDESFVTYFTKRFNDWLKKRYSNSSDDIQILNAQLKATIKEQQNLVNFVSQTEHPPLSILDSINEKEASKVRIEHELSFLKQRRSQNMFMLPANVKAYLKRFGEIMGSDIQNANLALKKLFPEGLKCTPEVVAGVATHNQHNSKWLIEGKMLVPSIQGGFSQLQFGGGGGN